MKVSFRSHPEVLHYQERLTVEIFLRLIFPHLHGCFDIFFPPSYRVMYNIEKKVKLHKISLSFHTYLLIFPAQLQSLHAGIAGNYRGGANN